MLERRLRKTIEWAFYNYKAMRDEAAQAIADAADKQLSVNYGGAAVKSSPGNTNERSVISAIDRAESYKWCKVVEQTLEHFEGTGKDTLVRLKYFERQREWRLCERLYVSRRALFEWVEDVITYAVMLGLQYGLVKIF